jgi:hypothetical protein
MKKNTKRLNKKQKTNAQFVGYNLARLRRYTNFENSNGNFTFLDPHKYVSLKYADLYSESLATVTGTNQVMNLNSIFDPDRTGTGHQPYGYDQLAALYNRYRVLAVDYKITFHAEALGFYIVVLPSNGVLATAITNQASYTLASESPRSQVRCQGVGANDVIIRGTIKLNELNGTTLTEYLADDRFQAIFGSNPTELILLNVGTYNQNGSTLVVDFTIELIYHCDIHDPIMLTQS